MTERERAGETALKIFCVIFSRGEFSAEETRKILSGCGHCADRVTEEDIRNLIEQINAMLIEQHPEALFS